MTQLSRRMSPMTLFMLSVNSIIGSGWLFAPFYAAKIAGAAAIFSWMIGGFAAILISLMDSRSDFQASGSMPHLLPAVFTKKILW